MDRTPLESWIEKWGISLDWEAKAKLREAVQEMVIAEPERMTVELCSECQSEKVLKFIDERFPPGTVTTEAFLKVPGSQIVRDKSGDEMLLWWSCEYECFMWTDPHGKGKQVLSSGGST